MARPEPPPQKAIRPPIVIPPPTRSEIATAVIAMTLFFGSMIGLVALGLFALVATLIRWVASLA
jgi:tetrahydromethanopterin S-methyltransferase subunit B